MADVTISAGNVKMKDSPRVPATIRVYALTDFNLADGTPIQASSPYNGGNAYKSVALTPSGSDPTIYAFSLFTIPATEDAAVNPNTARWGFFLFDGSTTPRLITHVSGLASARVPATPTPTTLSALALYNGGSLAPVVVNVAVSGTLTVGGVATFNGAVVMNGTLNGQGIIGGAGVADRISYWTDSDTLASSPFLRIDSDTVEQRGSGGANILHVSAGYVSGVDYSRAVISATTAVVIFGVERDGSAAEIPVRLASCNGGVIQFFQDGDNQWTINQDGHFIPEGDGVRDIGTTANPVRNVSTGNIDLCSGANVQASIVSIATSVVSFPDATGLLHSRLRYGPALDLFSGTVDPEGSQTASPGSIYSRTNGSVYKKTSGAGNTGWDELAAGGGVGYLVYRALLTQSGGGAPVATVLENTLGGTVVWARGGAGDYTATLAGAFTANKTMIVMGNSWQAPSSFGVIKSAWADANSLAITTHDVDLGGATITQDDSVLNATAIDVLVFP